MPNQRRSHMKRCARCGETKSFREDFPRYSPSYCRPCISAVQRVSRDRRTLKMAREDPAYRRRHRARVNAAQRRLNDDRSDKAKLRATKERFRRYGITEEIYNGMLAAQSHACLVCHIPEPTGNGWTIDHDHACCPGDGSCGQCIRGILCSRCNAALGMASDNPTTLRALAAYLDAWNARGTSHARAS